MLNAERHFDEKKKANESLTECRASDFIGDRNIVFRIDGQIPMKESQCCCLLFSVIL